MNHSSRFHAVFLNVELEIERRNKSLDSLQLKFKYLKESVYHKLLHEANCNFIQHFRILCLIFMVLLKPQGMAWTIYRPVCLEYETGAFQNKLDYQINGFP
jgi:hypothetical protein